jgi:hypothetical protein
MGVVVILWLLAVVRWQRSWYSLMVPSASLLLTVLADHRRRSLLLFTTETARTFSSVRVCQAFIASRVVAVTVGHSGDMRGRQYPHIGIQMADEDIEVGLRYLADTAFGR